MLTNKQLVLLEFILSNTKTKGISPSFDEMREALGLKSKSGIHRLISALEERGFLRRLPHRARALEVIKAPPQETVQNKHSSNSNVIKLNHDTKAIQMNSSFEIPLLGKIAAGLPIEAIEDSEQHVTVPDSMIGIGRHFALKVKGESMLEEGINHDDIVVIKEQNTATNGDIVVALIDDQEATLKKIYYKGRTIELRAANPQFKTQRFPSELIKIQGRLIGLLRSY